MQTMKWVGFLRRNKDASTAARLLLSIGGETPRKTLRKIEASLVAHEIDREGYAVRIDAYESMRAAYVAKEHTVDDLDPRDWMPCGGGFVRRNHVGSAGR